MKILLVAINAKYIHSNLAIYSLCAYAKRQIATGGVEIETAEYTVNLRAEEILQDIYRRSPDVLCFSCYIWNIAYTEELVREIHKILPKTDIWAGGPEVSYDAEGVLARLPQMKGVVKGEGEQTFAELCQAYEGAYERADVRLESVQGITYRSADGKIEDHPWREPLDLDTLPFVYESPDKSAQEDEVSEEGARRGCAYEQNGFKNKIIYYETSRGCPFSCSYCLSSVEKRLRLRSISLIEPELQFFLDRKIPQVKLVDRTFNCNHEHAMAIWTYIAEHDNGITNFRFEVAADLLAEEELSLIESMRPGLIQLEIGVQSTNPGTLREIRRTMDFRRVRENVARLKKAGNVHQHLDLIAGLPFEDIKSFARSFDDVYMCKPDQLQLGFLKVLKGSYMEENKEAYGLVYKSAPPYEVLYTKWLSYRDVLELKGIEEMVETYYNSGQFTHTLEALGLRYNSPYQMYKELWRYCDGQGFLKAQHKREARYEMLLSFVQEYFPEHVEEMREFLIYDYYLRENARSRPRFAGEYTVEKELLRGFYEKEARERRYLSEYQLYDKNQMRKMTHIEKFKIMGKILLFDYKCRNPLNREARTCMIIEEEDEERTR